MESAVCTGSHEIIMWQKPKEEGIRLENRKDKTIDYSKVIVFIAIFIALIGIAVGAYNNSKYRAIIFGNSSFLLPKRVAENVSRSEGEDYVFLQSEDYLVLGVGPDSGDLDNTILDHFGITNEDLDKVKSVKTEYDLSELVGFDEGSIVYCGKTNKPSYDKYFIQYRTREYDEIILVFTSEGKSVIEIIIAPQNDITKKKM